MGSFSIWHWLIVALVLWLVFRAKRPSPAAASLATDGLGHSWTLPVPRSNQDTYSRAERLRDRMAVRFAALRPEGLALTTYESTRGDGDIWLRLEVIKPDLQRPELSLRTVIAITVERHDFHRFEHALTLEVGRGPLRRRLRGLIEFNDDDVRALLAFASGEKAPFPRITSRRLRRFGWQLWRPRNRIARLRRDWLDTIVSAAGALGLAAGAADLYLPELLGQQACVFEDCEPTLRGGLLMLAGAAVLGVRWLMLRRRKTLTLNAGKPLADPRTLVRMDSWQVTIDGLGERREALQQALLATLAQRQPPGVTLRGEMIGYASSDSKVERQQQVISFRRAIAFVRLESYGQDLYIGWDSHINAGVWVEQDIARGVDRLSGMPVVARRVVKGWQAPSEYDVSDASFLTEWLHACVVSVVKLQMAEHHIDQEIDFTIQRESRSDALRSQRPGGESKARRFGQALFRRTA